MVTLETDRLTIRNFRPDDWPALHEMAVRYEATSHAAYDQQWPTSPEEIRAVAEWFAGGDSYLAVCLRETGQLVGLIALAPDEADGQLQLDLGYVFDQAFHGRGYGGEACRAALGLAFGQMGAARVTSGTAAANAASVRLLERLGFARVAEVTAAFRTDDEGRPVEFPGYRYALTRAAWEAGAPG